VATLIARRRPWLIVAVSLGLLVVLVFGGRVAWRLGHRLLGPPPPPRQTDVAQIADWMSLPYVSRAYRVPLPELDRPLGIEPAGRRVRPLHEIAEVTGRPSDEVVTLVRETVSAWQAAHPDARPPGPPRPPWRFGRPGS
jgi:hypothetical protein